MGRPRKIQPELDFKAAWVQMQDKVADNAKKKGFWEDQNPNHLILWAHSELSELYEALKRGEPAITDEAGKPGGWAVEAADVVIILMDLCARKGIQLGNVIEFKHAHNLTREVKNGDHVT